MIQKNFSDRKFFNIAQLNQIPAIQKLPEEKRFEMEVVSKVLPFRTNNYIVENLIDWDRIPDDPIFRLNFMHRDMLCPKDFESVAEALKNGVNGEKLHQLIFDIRMNLNPHPAGQLTLNVPELDGEPVPGVQHKYRETCLIFPNQGQTCFAYCTFCFRWPQFVKLNNHKFATGSKPLYLEYVKQHKEITDVLITGGDPMVMSADILESHIAPYLKPEFDHIQTIRIGSKVLGHWPYRFLTDPDAESILRLFEKVVESGKHFSFMAHFNHPRELSTRALEDAVKRIRSTGAEVRTQSPILKNINDSTGAWAEMWQKQVSLGIIPYYMFVERNTGAQRYFEVPLARSLEIYRSAVQKVSGLARTVRGPSMSALPGKVCVEGMADIRGEKVFVLTFLQARNPDWVKRPFFARYDEKAVWISDLKPAFGEEKFFFEDELREMLDKYSQKKACELKTGTEY